MESPILLFYGRSVVGYNQLKQPIIHYNPRKRDDTHHGHHNYKWHREYADAIRTPVKTQENGQ